MKKSLTSCLVIALLLSGCRTEASDSGASVLHQVNQVESPSSSFIDELRLTQQDTVMAVSPGNDDITTRWIYFYFQANSNDDVQVLEKNLADTVQSAKLYCDNESEYLECTELLWSGNSSTDGRVSFSLAVVPDKCTLKEDFASINRIEFLTASGSQPVFELHNYFILVYPEITGAIDEMPISISASEELVQLRYAINTENPAVYEGAEITLLIDDESFPFIKVENSMLEIVNDGSKKQIVCLFDASLHSPVINSAVKPAIQILRDDTTEIYLSSFPLVIE